MNARREALGQPQGYTDIHDYVDRIRPALEERAAQYGVDPMLVATDPQLVEAVYQGLKGRGGSFHGARPLPGPDRGTRSRVLGDSKLRRELWPQ